MTEKGKINKEVHKLPNDTVIPQIKAVIIFDENDFSKCIWKEYLVNIGKDRKYFVGPNNSRIVTFIVINDLLSP